MVARARGAPPARQGAAEATPAEQQRDQEHRDEAKLHARDALDVPVESAIARDAEEYAVRVAEASARAQYDASTAARRLKERRTRALAC